MFPNSSILGHPPFIPKPQSGNNIFSQLPLNNPPALISQQQLIEADYNFRNSNFHRIPLNAVPRFPTIPSHDWIPGTSTSHVVHTVQAISQGRKRRGDEYGPSDLKRQRFHSPSPCLGVVTPASSPAAARKAAVPLRSEGHRSGLSLDTALSPLTPKPGGCVPPLRSEPRSSVTNRLLPPAQDKLSQQVLELFQVCQQQNDDLEKKELCRAQLQWEIQRLIPHSRVYLAGSSLNGFGSRSSDADLCLVVQEGPMNQRTDAVYILSLVQKLFYRLTYIERPQLIRAKVPILKFRDKVSGVEFDLNVNNVVGIRNTFLLRTYAYIENRVRPIILVVKKWARHHGINDASRGTLSSYSLVLMVLHYLQTLPEPVIPCLQREYPECFNPSMDIHLVPEGPRNIPPYTSKNESTLGDLFLGFLKYYATVFNWEKYMISVREAKALPRPNSKEWKQKYICVEEPFERSNTARAVHEKVKFDAIKAEFLESWRILQLKKDLNFILPLRATLQKR
uniref:polynucleotide adenylyltransferase n=1 Tax=Lepisosteus oculatus TaxID=7918 RepID=W5MFN1_LEPOC|nr:PREDICTED: poly(A) RNA polymerase GLD2 [Lepisosteus oculatus]XP_015220995.1 PREDICTED: poly(A) RNA polymerase GLD2 [Lepisosteus oculatus]XP_015221003.1 PREDICTED: poly(A) RNA polymerase GLD2 [Lepisosteus oculatus]